jgi:3' terminal RNA ribose 2'-O-methyltransferase Hen1
LDARFPQWGNSPYFSVGLTSETRLRDLLSHLYVLLPVLDDDKHYWVGDDEVGKLLRHGEGWLDGHPERNLIARRYLKHQRNLWRQALAQLLDAGRIDPGDTTTQYGHEEEQLEAPLRLSEQRVQAVMKTLRELGATRVLDLGCGEGKLIGELVKDPGYSLVTGFDASHRALETARERLRLDTMPDRQRQRVNLLHGSLTYRDKRLSGFDAAVAMEVIEHIDLPRLDAFEEVVFGSAKPGAVLVTTPNAEYNVLFEGLLDGEFRHRDHRFEWTREQFQTWARRVAARRGYDVGFESIGPDDSARGAPTQLGVFTR